MRLALPDRTRGPVGRYYGLPPRPPQTRDGPNTWSDGSLYDPESGNTYSGKLSLNPDGTLSLRGISASLCSAGRSIGRASCKRSAAALATRIRSSIDFGKAPITALAGRVAIVIGGSRGITAVTAAREAYRKLRGIASARRGWLQFNSVHCPYFTKQPRRSRAELAQ